MEPVSSVSLDGVDVWPSIVWERANQTTLADLRIECRLPDPHHSRVLASFSPRVTGASPLLSTSSAMIHAVLVDCSICPVANGIYGD